MNRMIKRRSLPALLAAIFVVLAALACHAPGGPTPTTEAPPTPTLPQAGEEETGPTPSLPPAATDTPVPDVAGPGGCTLNAAYVADVTVPDGTEFPPGAAFTKTWRVRNSGSCAWEIGTQLVFASGEPMGGPAAVNVPSVAPGSNTDISVDMVAPATPGAYKSNWQLQSPDGTRFGSMIYVQIVVPAPPTDTPEPTVTPTEEATQEATAEPTPGCVDVDPALEPILSYVESLDYDLGCPTASASSVPGAFQEFWANVDEPNPHLHFRSLMIWRSDNSEIYVIDGENTDASEGTLLAYTDTWEEGQPDVHPDCDGMTPPDGYQLPIRGFGKIWCAAGLWEPVGWPVENEIAVTLFIQPMQTGLLMKVSGPPTGYLVALDYRAVRGWTMMTAP